MAACSKHRAQPNARHARHDRHTKARGEFRDVESISHAARRSVFAVQASHVVCRAASVWAICKVRTQRRKKFNVSCSIRDSSHLFDLALDARGFRLAFGKSAAACEAHRVGTFDAPPHFLHLLAEAHATHEPAYFGVRTHVRTK